MKITVVGPDMDICKPVYRHGLPHTEARANAQLIAAAPDMYAALQKCLWVMEGIGPEFAETAMDEGRAALAKALAAS